MTLASTNAALFAHKRILASAGSGKTFQLTNRYLALIAAGAEPGSILASTFTRAAAGEIRNRILMRLAEAADSEDASRGLGAFIGRDSLTRADTLSLLANLARNVHRMNVRTLDSFFASVVSAFALELGIPPGSQIISEARDAQLRAEAIRLMLDERDPQEMIDLLRLLTQGNSTSRISSAIDETVSTLYGLFRETESEAWEQVPELPTLDREQLEIAIATLADMEIPEKKSLIKTRAADVQRCHERDWEKFLSTGIAAKIAAGEETFGRVELPGNLVEAYVLLTEHARGVLVERVRKQTLATRDLLGYYHVQYQRLKRRHGAMTFADFTYAMNEAERRGSFDEICYRLDASIQHLLLDEFQDTSVGQWNALRPFIEEIVNNQPPDHTFFCVGDVKQSIYGWRDAAPDVLEHMPDLIPGADESTIVLETLAKSYRSAPVVMESLNRVFCTLTDNPALVEQPEVAAAWSGWYQTHETARDLSGYVELKLAPQARVAADRKSLRYAMAAKKVEELHHRNPDISIVVLTRTNDAVASILHELKLLQVPASGRGGGPLTDSPPVNAILDLLQLADHPGDTMAAFNLAHSPLGSVVGAKLDLADRNRGRARDQLARKVRRMLLQQGYADTISGWVKAMASECDEKQLRRLMQLIELAGEYDGIGSLRPGDFIEVVETTRVAESRPAPVQVMNFHQCKGLEFDAVVLPELENRFTGETTPSVVFQRTGAADEITRICRYMNRDLRELVPELQPLFDQHTNRTVRETLCVLYVAMTRAKQGLYMIIDPPAENEKTLPKRISSLLRCALGQEPLDPGRVVYAHGDPDWMDQVHDESSKPEEALAPPETMIETATQISLASTDVTPRYGMSASAASRHTSLSDFTKQLVLSDDEPLDRGTVIHGLFEQIDWLDHWQADEAELFRLAAALAPKRGQDWVQQRVEEFREMIEAGDVREKLSLGDRPADSMGLWREVSYARIVDGRIQQGRIDRLTAELDDQGRPVRGTVIDFKSDRIDPRNAPNEAEENYRQQLETYREPAARRLGLDPSAISLVVLYVSAGVAVELD